MLLLLTAAQTARAQRPSIDSNTQTALTWKPNTTAEASLCQWHQTKPNQTQPLFVIIITKSNQSFYKTMTLQEKRSKKKKKSKQAKNFQADRL